MASGPVSLKSIVRLENAQYGHISMDGREMTGALTQLAETVDGITGASKDGFVDRTELEAYQATIDANSRWTPLAKESESDRVSQLLGYEAKPHRLEKDTEKAEKQARDVATGFALMMGAGDKVPKADVDALLEHGEAALER